MSIYHRGIDDAEHDDPKLPAPYHAEPRPTTPRPLVPCADCAPAFHAQADTAAQDREASESLRAEVARLTWLYEDTHRQKRELTAIVCDQRAEVVRLRLLLPAVQRVSCGGVEPRGVDDMTTESGPESGPSSRVDDANSSRTEH